MRRIPERRATQRRTARWIATATLAAACAQGGDSERSTVADSGGVTVRTNLAGSVSGASPWTLSSEPVVEIGAEGGGPVTLYRVASVVPLGGGRSAVVTNAPPQVLVFTADGAVAATLGRDGDGPGEFSTEVASVVPLAADSFAVWDPGRRRMSVFTSMGEFGREVDLRGIAPLSPRAAGDVVEVSGFTELLPWGDGTLVLFAVGVFGPGEGVRRVAAPSFRITPAGEEVTRFGPIPGNETFMSPTMGLGPYPFGAETHGDVADGRLVVGTADGPEYRVYGPEGRLVRIVRWPDHDRAFGGPIVEAWNDFLDEWLSGMPGMGDAIREFLDGMPVPEVFPAWGDLITSEDGDVWIAPYVGPLSLPGTPLNVRVPERRWLVFDGEGVLVATVDTPAGFQPHAVVADRVWGVFRDSLDVETVRAYSLGRIAGEGLEP